MTLKSNQELSYLYKVVAMIDSEEDARAFFEDICTPTEINALSQRLDVASRLRKGQSFNKISAETGASTATISRVSRCLSRGSGGYQTALEKLNK